MEKSDAPNVKSGISAEVLRDINAQYAVLDSAVKLINRLLQDSERKTEHVLGFGEWVYNMEQLESWLKRYIEP